MSCFFFLTGVLVAQSLKWQLENLHGTFTKISLFPDIMFLNYVRIYHTYLLTTLPASKGNSQIHRVWTSFLKGGKRYPTDKEWRTEHNALSTG